MRELTRKKYDEMCSDCPACGGNGGHFYCMKEECIFGDDEDGGNTGEEV